MFSSGFLLALSISCSVEMNDRAGRGGVSSNQGSMATGHTSLPMGRIMSGETTSNPLHDLRFLNSKGKMDFNADPANRANENARSAPVDKFAVDEDPERPLSSSSGFESKSDSRMGPNASMRSV